MENSYHNYIVEPSRHHVASYFYNLDNSTCRVADKKIKKEELIVFQNIFVFIIMRLIIKDKLDYFTCLVCSFVREGFFKSSAMHAKMLKTSFLCIFKEHPIILLSET